jgi:aryl-alcohol dehydrogenase-like predicted oxidoreductase
MNYKKLGNTNIEVSTVALGCMSLCGNMTYQDIPEAQAVTTVHAAMDAGINFFDNAPAYGDGVAEERLGKALRGRREKAVVATKINSPRLDEKEVVTELETSLKRLGMDHVDYYQIHWPKRVVPIDETFTALEKMVRAGKVKALGVCNFGPKDMGEFIDKHRVETNQVAYSLLLRGPEFDLREMCLKRNIGFLCYSPLAQGLLAGKFTSADEVPAERARTRHFAGTRPQARHGEPGFERETFDAIAKVNAIAQKAGVPVADLALAWLLHQPVVTSVLAGASRPDQAIRNARAVSVKLSPETLKQLDEATAIVKEKVGPNLDPWQGGANSRIR